ncbi:MAG: hypothetical protein ACFFGP_12745 [Promethearchaeota archaeon]
MFFEWNFVDNFFRPLGTYAGFFLLILGIMWLIYAIYETKRRGSFEKRKVEEWEHAEASKFLKVLTYFGFVVGIFSLLCGISGLMYNAAPSQADINVTGDHASTFTSIFLIIFGILTFLKPSSDLPIPTIIGLLAASAVIIILVSVMPQSAYQVVDVFISAKWFFIILFIVIFAVVALTTKFYIGALMKISKGVSWPPLAFIIASFCILQGFLLLVVGVSITGLF